MIEISVDLDCVGIWCIIRDGELFICSFFVWMFYKFINWIVEMEMVDGVCDFCVMIW